MNNRRIIMRLKARTALHVGAGEGDAVTDAFVRRDSKGVPLIPGTSLAGALRAAATRLAPRLFAGELCLALWPPPRDDDPESMKKRREQACGCAVCRLFGDVNPPERSSLRPAEREERGRSSGGTPAAARLWIFDAWPVDPKNADGNQPGRDDKLQPRPPATAIRDGVGIDRSSGAAYRRGQAKFDLETLPAGVQFELRLELEADSKETEAEQEKLLAAVLSEWKNGRGSVGGRTSRGLGALEAESDPLYQRLNFGDKDQLFDFICSDDPWHAATTDPRWLERRIEEIRPSVLPDAQGETETETARTWARLKVRIRAAGPFLVNDPVSAAESSFDHAPSLSGGDRLNPVIPGAGVKGALRSQAERIARTLATREAVRSPDPSQRKAKFLRTCPACNPLVGEADQALASCDALLKRQRSDGRPVLKSTEEATDKHLCLACRLFGSTRRGSRLRVEDASIVGEPVYKPLDFLAIDRFTGGGAGGLKFDAAALWRPRFEVVLHLENPRPWELGWLLLALRDFNDGLATLGFGAAKGFGQVAAEEWTLSVAWLTQSDAQKLKIPLSGREDLEGLYSVSEAVSEQMEAWRTAAQHWIDEFQDLLDPGKRDGVKRVEGDDPESLPALLCDTYFGTAAEQLYPLEALDE